MNFVSLIFLLVSTGVHDIAADPRHFVLYCDAPDRAAAEIKKSITWALSFCDAVGTTIILFRPFIEPSCFERFKTCLKEIDEQI